MLVTTVLNHPPEIKKSAKWSKSSSDKTMTSPASIKNFKIRPLGGFEKMRVLYVAMAEKPLSAKYLGNGTSDHRIEIFQKTNPPKPEKTHLRSHF